MWRDFVFLLRKVGGILNTAFYVSIGTKLSESIFLKKIFFLNYRTLRWKVSASSRNFLDRFFKNEFFVYIKRFWSKRLSFKNKIFLIFFGFCVTNFRLIVEKVDGVVKSTFYISIGTLWGKLFPPEKKCHTLSLSANEQNFSGNCRKNSKRFVKTAFHVSKKTLCWNNRFGEKKISSLADVEQKFVGFCKRIFSRLVERAFFASIGTLWGESFSKKYVFFSFGYSGKKNFGFCGELSDKSFETVFFSCSWELFEASGFFSEEKSYLLWILVDELLSVCWENIGGVIKTAFYESRGKFWAESYFWGILSQFRTLPGKISTSSRIFLNGFVKTEFHAYIGKFEGKSIPFAWKCTFISSGHWAKYFGSLWNLFHRGCQKCIRRFLGTSLKETFSAKNLSFVDIEWNKFQLFVYKIWAVLSKLHSTGP